MSGHSKWAQIKHKKAIIDVKRAGVFGKIARAITVAAREKGSDPNANPTLRTMIQKAREANMPQDNIDRAIKKGSGEGEEALQEFTYEAYGPGGVAIVLTGITDNNNRTSNEIKHLLSGHGGKWANPGSVLWAFEKKENEWEPKPYTMVSVDTKTEEALFRLMEVLDEHDDVQEVYANNTES